MAKVTLLQVAAAAQLSKTTTSDILRGAEGDYNAATVEHVRATAARLGYRANAAARLLRQGSTNLVGIATGVRQRPHINNLVVEAHDECLRRGLQPVIFEPAHLLPRHGYSPFPSPDLLSGVLSIDLSMEQSLPDFYRVLRSQLPLVALYATEVVGVDAVAADWALGMRLAVEHLVMLGHQHIAYVHDPESIYATDRIRARAWRECRRDFKLPRPKGEEVTYQTPRAWIESGQQVVNLPQPIDDYCNQTLEALQRAAPKPTALICTSDELAIALIGRLTALGWRLPEQLSLIGFYGSDWGQYSHPRLTSVAPLLRRIVTRALDLLESNIALYATGERAAAQTLTVPPELLVRESTATVGGG